LGVVMPKSEATSRKSMTGGWVAMEALCDVRGVALVELPIPC